MITVQRGGKGALTFTFLHPDTFEPVTLLAPNSQVDILDVGGSSIAAAQPVVVSGTNNNIVTYTPTSAWDQDEDEGYIAVWTLGDGTNTWERRTYFRIARRLFVSQVDDEYVRGLQPELSTAWTSSMAEWRRSAWRSLEQHVTRAMKAAYLDSPHEDIQYPGQIFDPEVFELGHAYWTLRDFYRAASTDGGGDDATRAKEYHQEGLREIQSALGDLALDLNDDGRYQKPTESRQWARADWGN